MTIATCEKCRAVYDDIDLQYNRNDQLVCPDCQDTPMQEVLNFNQDFIDLYQISLKW
jgi:hypothetical protein